MVRNLEVIGEAAGRMPLPYRTKWNEVPWQRIVGLRNRIVHEYFDVDLEIVWEIVVTELPVLAAQLQRVLSEDVSDTDRGK